LLLTNTKFIENIKIDTKRGSPERRFDYKQPEINNYQTENRNKRNSPITSSKQEISNRETLDFSNNSKSELNRVRKYNNIREFRISTEREQKLDIEDDEISLDKSLRKQDSLVKPSNLFRIEENETPIGYEDPQMAKLEPKFGFHLIQYFNLYFGSHEKYERYHWDAKRCRVKKIIANKNSSVNKNDESLDTEFSNTLKISDLRQTCSSQKEFLKQYITININFNELWEVFTLGILNTYIKILDVYSSYLHDRRQLDNPDIRRKRVKLFDTYTVSKVVKDQQMNRGGDISLDEDELKNFFSYDIVILPFYDPKINRCCLTVIEMSEEDIYITLWDRYRSQYTEQQLEDMNASISYDVIDFLERSFFGNGDQLNHEKLHGVEEEINVSNEEDMIPAILQLAEAIVVNQDTYEKNEDIELVRHKIIDRIASLHLID
jgi:hypothetical protein